MVLLLFVFSVLLCLSVVTAWIAFFLQFLGYSSVLSTASSILCRAGLVDINSFSLFTLWQVFLCLSMVDGNFAEYSSLYWHLWCFRIWSRLLWVLLAMISIEKSAVIVMGFSFMWIVIFLVQLFKPSIFCIFSVLIILCPEVSLLILVFSVLCALCICMDMSIFNLGVVGYPAPVDKSTTQTL